MTTQTISPAYRLQSVTFTQDSTHPYILNINAQDEFYITRKIGSFNFFHKYGHLTMLDGSTKEYKQWNSLFNNFFKWDNMFGYTDTDIKAAITAGKEAIKQEKRENELAIQRKEEEKANNYLTQLKDRNEEVVSKVINLIDKSDSEIQQIIINTFKSITSELFHVIFDEIRTIQDEYSIKTPEEKIMNDSTISADDFLSLCDQYGIELNYSLVQWIKNKLNRIGYARYEYTGYFNKDVSDIMYKLYELIENKLNNQTKQESFHLYKNTFSTYSEAYNHALNYRIPVTMIISNNHPSMTNERLQQLEHEYVFSKGSMSISDIQEYFTYISSLDTTLDQQERYFKLKSYIDRHNYSQQQKQTQKERQHNLMKEAATILYFMKKKGLSLIEKGDCGIVSTKYIYNNETIYHEVRGSGGITIEKYHQMITDIFNKHFSQYRDEYNELTLYWYTLPSKEYNHLMNIEGFMFTDMTKGEHGIICFDRLLSVDENKLYNLQLHN